MKYVLVVLLLATVAVAGTGCGGDDEEEDVAAPATVEPEPVPPEDAIVDRPIGFDLMPVNDSGVSGSVKLNAAGEDRTNVTILLDSQGSRAPHPAHIHRGSCDNLNKTPFAPLDTVANGESETTVNVPVIELLDGEFAVNVHQSMENLDVYIACGNVPDKGDVSVSE